MIGNEIRARVLKTSINIIRRSKKLRFAGLYKGAVMALVLLNIFILPANISLSGMGAVAIAGIESEVWWPQNNVTVQGVQPFKAVLSDTPVESYEMFWQVDGGSWNWMDNNYNDYPHKQASVDLSSWNWRGPGPYTLNFIARQNGIVVSERAVTIYIGAQSVSAPAARPTSVTEVAQSAVGTPETQKISVIEIPQQPPAPAASGALSSLTLYVNQNSPAARQANEWRNSRPNDARAMDTLASAPSASWFGGWSGDVEQAVRSTVEAARKTGSAPVLVAYNIPQRDCGGYSAGGVGSSGEYTRWIGAFARGIGDSNAVVILEPDSLAGIACLSSSDQQRRMELLWNAVSILKSNSGTRVYLDAGHSGWVDAGTISSRLQASNISRADGFALNVSNFNTTAAESAFGTEVSRLLNGKHFVIDTSRNGNGSNGEWCNPWGRRSGEKPSVSTGNTLIDAYLWVKTPGESDGNCNGGPSAGAWWPEYGLSLTR
jgi:endoglucanase